MKRRPRRSFADGATHQYSCTRTNGRPSRVHMTEKMVTLITVTPTGVSIWYREVKSDNVPIFITPFFEFTAMIRSSAVTPDPNVCVSSRREAKICHGFCAVLKDSSPRPIPSVYLVPSAHSVFLFSGSIYTANPVCLPDFLAAYISP